MFRGQSANVLPGTTWLARLPRVFCFVLFCFLRIFPAQSQNVSAWVCSSSPEGVGRRVGVACFCSRGRLLWSELRVMRPETNPVRPVSNELFCKELLHLVVGFVATYYVLVVFFVLRLGELWL